MEVLTLNNRAVPLKNLNKIYSKDDGVLKAEIIEYYANMANFLIPHIQNKPFSQLYFPEGVGGKMFYQKQKPVNAPAWLNSVTLPSSKKGELEWCLVNDAASVVYMANRSVIEMHTWFSRLPNLAMPDVAVIDLDPSGGSGFNEARVLAKAFGVLLKELNIFAVPKTSGGRGMHIYIPIKPIPFVEIQQFLQTLCSIIALNFKNIATTERTVNKRGDKIYLDYIQNAYGKTIAAPYSLRARGHLPVSAPLLWSELDDINLNPATFNIKNIFNRIETVGDLFKDFYLKAQALPAL
jgi:bifunctional non-homologous end joining protein LigD